ncbi:uncharacterized protein METZ01_LOCUS197834, partial [marine metagenome]
VVHIDPAISIVGHAVEDVEAQVVGCVDDRLDDATDIPL